MPTDKLVTVPGSGSAPQTYAIAAAQEVILKAAFAQFDGSGAAAAYLPCLRILAPSGQVVAECTTPTSVAAGGSAQVSFFPRAATAAGTSGAALEIEHNGANVGSEPALDFADSGSVTFTVTDTPGTKVLVSAAAAGGSDLSFAWFQAASTGASPWTWNSLQTNDVAVFSIDGGDATKARLATAGVYICQGEYINGPAVINTPFRFVATLFGNGGGAINNQFLADWDDASVGDTAQIFHVFGGGHLSTAASADTPFYVQATSTPAGAAGTLSMYLTRISTTPSV